MPREPLNSRVIGAAGADPAPGPRAIAFRNQRIYCSWAVPPTAGRVREDAESARAACAAPIHRASAGGRPVTRARATPPPAAPR